jgi:hypothetical protein
MAENEYFVCVETLKYESTTWFGPYTKEEMKKIEEQRAAKTRKTALAWIRIEGTISGAPEAGTQIDVDSRYTVIVSKDEGQRALWLSPSRLPLWRHLVEICADDDHQVQEIYRGIYIDRLLVDNDKK